jgi:hypothetical protein
VGGPGPPGDGGAGGRRARRGRLRARRGRPRWRRGRPAGAGPALASLPGLSSQQSARARVHTQLLTPAQPLTRPRPLRPPDAETKDTPDAPEAARKELAKLGPLSRDEKITAAAFLLTVGLWIGGASLGVNAVAAATVGLAILLITGGRGGCVLGGLLAVGRGGSGRARRGSGGGALMSTRARGAARARRFV